MTDCIFCKIAAQEIPAEIIYEDANHLAFLDINPTTRGMTVVISKNHYGSDIYTNEVPVICKIMGAAKKTATLLQNKLNPVRVLTMIEGLEIEHLHIKLYPFYGDMAPSEAMISHGHPKPSQEELRNIAQEIRNE
jgi:histidine triad (HIT) family protein